MFKIFTFGGVHHWSYFNIADTSTVVGQPGGEVRPSAVRLQEHAHGQFGGRGRCPITFTF
jgi:hypothetical protein